MPTASATKRVAQLTFVVVIFGLFYASTRIPSERIESFTHFAGWYGPLAIWFCLLLTQIFAPLSGTPVMIVGIRLYGYPTAMVLLYVSCLVSAVVNFWIARVYGRQFVKLLVGTKTLNTIDDLSCVNEKGLLFAGRLLGFPFYDVVSYAVGLTQINFRRYFAYSALVSVIPFAIYYLLFSRIDFDSFSGLLVYFISIVLLGLVSARVIHKHYIEKSLK